MFGVSYETLMNYMVRALVLFTAMPVHECAHGLIADKLGDDTARRQGRLTLNPFVHLDMFGSILLLISGFGWAKPVQVDTRNFKRPRRDMALTSLAGPMSNVIIALLLLIIFKFGLGFLPQMRNAETVKSFMMILSSMIFINISLAVFNILPVPPLDGSKIFGIVLPEKLYWNMLRYQQVISIIVMLLLFTGILTPVIQTMSNYLLTFLDYLTLPIDWIFR